MTLFGPWICLSAQTGVERQVRWRSLAGHPPPKRVVEAPHTISVDAAYRLADSGTGVFP